MVAVWGRHHEFGDISWLPAQGKVVLRKDDRVNVSTPGDGANNFLAFRPKPAAEIIHGREEEDRLKDEGSDDAICQAPRVQSPVFKEEGFGFTNDGESFTGYPVVGYQHRIQASDACQDVLEEEEEHDCLYLWDP
ncbi:hypothetical protein EJB05_50714, partial [Eragrostis curvula]